MNELKEELTKIISNDGWVDTCEVDVDDSVDKIMQLIETYTSKKELEARIDEWNLASEYRHSSNITGELYFNNGMIERINQLQSQLKESL